jgi:hypothetical protein
MRQAESAFCLGGAPSSFTPHFLRGAGTPLAILKPNRNTKTTRKGPHASIIESIINSSDRPADPIPSIQKHQPPIEVRSQPGAKSEVHLQRPTSPVAVPEFPADEIAGKLQRSIDSVMSSSDLGANEMIAGKTRSQTKNLPETSPKTHLNNQKPKSLKSILPHPDPWCPESRLVAIVRRLITAPCTRALHPAFSFEPTQKATTDNMNLLRAHKFDFTAIMKGQFGSTAWYGSEFKSVTLLEPLFHNHEL